MRNKDRDMSSPIMGSPSDRLERGRSHSDSSSRISNERIRNMDYDPDIDEEEDDLQRRQREGNLGNERVRQSER